MGFSEDNGLTETLFMAAIGRALVRKGILKKTDLQAEIETMRLDGGETLDKEVNDLLTLISHSIEGWKES